MNHFRSPKPNAKLRHQAETATAAVKDHHPRDSIFQTEASDYSDGELPPLMSKPSLFFVLKFMTEFFSALHIWYVAMANRYLSDVDELRNMDEFYYFLNRNSYYCYYESFISVLHREWMQHLKGAKHSAFWDMLSGDYDSIPF